MPISFVQQATGSLSTSTPTLAFAANVGAGSMLFACVQIPDTTTTVSGITDTLGNTWSLTKRQIGTTRAAEMWHAHAPAGGANTITVSFSAAAICQFNISEFAGFSAGMTAGPTNGANDTTSPQTCGEITTTVAASLILATLAIDTAFSVSSRLSGWVGLTGANRRDSQYKIATATETTDGAVTMAADEVTAGAIAAWSETVGAAVSALNRGKRPHPFSPGASRLRSF